MKFDLYRRRDGALVAVPSAFPGAGMLDPASLRFVRTTHLELRLLSDGFVLELGLQGFAVAQGVDAALLRNHPDVVSPAC